MRRRTVKAGVRLITGGVTAVILSTFFHDRIAALFYFSPGGETQLVYLGLFCGAMLGFLGIVLTVTGLVRAQGTGSGEKILPSIVILVMVVLLFFILLFVSFKNPEHPRIRPGETVTI